MIFSSSFIIKILAKSPNLPGVRSLITNEAPVEKYAVEYLIFRLRPLKINFNALQEIFLVCNNVVKEINNFLFEKILDRNVSEGLYSWEWDLRKDKNEFIKYYNLFVSEKNPPIQIPSLKKAYEEFRKTFGDQI